MFRVGIVAALEREISGFLRGCVRVTREHEGRSFVFFECGEIVAVCGGIGAEPSRRAAEALVALDRPSLLLSVGFAGALQPRLKIGDVLVPSVVVDARDGSRSAVTGGDGTTLITFMEVAGLAQKANLARAYGAQIVDMEAAAVAAAARAHGIEFRAVKAVSDDSSFEMPQMEQFVEPDGSFKTAGFALHTALRPWRWGRILRLGRNSRKASRALSAYLTRLRVEGSPATAAISSSGEAAVTHAAGGGRG
ncbi:MAG TPA: phosphorylase [Candidatus Binatia bacterium]|nr:phosphorylase [Candidatus Binatia bacterium]